MTNAEAIEILRANYPDACYGQLREAVDMAIEALKAQLFNEGTTSDLISRMETVEHLRRVLDATVPITDYDEGYVDGVEFGISTVSTMPTVQPEPQEGHWIRRDCGLDVECKCSRCGYKDFVEPRDEYWFKRNYCPNCGARMKGERQK